MTRSTLFSIGCLVFCCSIATAQAQSSTKAPPSTDSRIYAMIEASSAERIESDIRTLAGFGTRNTFSDTLSTSRGIGAARRWIKREFDAISEACNACLEVYFQRSLIQEGSSSRAVKDVWVVNVIAIQRGTRHPDNYVIMSGDIDSRNSSGTDGEGDAPGANDNASGMAGTLEAARLLSQYSFPNSIVYAGLSGEEQGLWGGAYMASIAQDEDWNVVGVLNNDMIGNIEGVDGVIDNSSFRVFSEPTPITETDQARGRRRFEGGEVDGVSRQLARYVDRMTDIYFTNLDAKLIYRLDRFGRGGHHRPFNDAGFPGIRIMETHENYVRQHQNIREENGVKYGDVIEGVNFDYAARLTAVNAVALAGLAWAPPSPDQVRIGGAVRPSTTLQWDAVEDPELAGYKIHWRETTAPQWTHSRFVDSSTTQFTLKGMVIDNFLFGVSAIGRDGNESVVVFPSGRLQR
ncbi:MAG: M28 family metallopeptidase [Rhodothermales bacterium]|nr:M28 family metallopeptidase [Rhodothermales bacterium]MDG2016662.1 M28 family metallopeptidase [Rhodothermales bacterium]